MLVLYETVPAEGDAKSKKTSVVTLRLAWFGDSEEKSVAWLKPWAERYAMGDSTKEEIEAAKEQIVRLDQPKAPTAAASAGGDEGGTSTAAIAGTDEIGKQKVKVLWNKAYFPCSGKPVSGKTTAAAVMKKPVSGKVQTEKPTAAAVFKKPASKVQTAKPSAAAVQISQPPESDEDMGDAYDRFFNGCDFDEL